MLLDVLWLVCDHPNQGVELDDGHAEIQEVDWVAKQVFQRWQKFFKVTTRTFFIYCFILA